MIGENNGYGIIVKPLIKNKEAMITALQKLLKPRNKFAIKIKYDSIKYHRFVSYGVIGGGADMGLLCV